MKLTRYKVTNFRSVQDSGWINCDDVTTLVGINEAGKSNLLLALWKLNPAAGGVIDILHDMPVDKLSVMREQLDTVFIEACFVLSEPVVNKINEEVGCEFESGNEVMISRKYDGSRTIKFLNGYPKSTLTKEISSELEDGSKETKTVSIEYDSQKLVNAVVKHMPKFVYYSNYGNLSTRIYLPNVITWLNNGTVSGIDINEDQVRTLKVLFKFVNLEPKEILELGKDTTSSYRDKSEIEKVDKKKEERSILLQSASTNLTKSFKEWWKQGEYKFRFEADGDYFRIWVSDEKRPAEVSLDQRSTGLQWFLSFYLIFLVESQDEHKNAVLLLDEAGLTLHPLAQRDLSKFFNELSKTNQIINTTHSPFIVDTNNIDRCKVVYMDENGQTVASDNLRQSSDKLNEQSIYAVHAALGLRVSDVLLQGCKPIIVEGPSDQIYLNAIKVKLISEKKITPKEEIIFIPSGGVKGIPGVVSILGAKSGELPIVLVDSDNSGQGAANKLKSGLYKDDKSKIIELSSFLSIQNGEIEDFIPYQYFEKLVDRMFRDVDDEDFEFNKEIPIVKQIEGFASKYNIVLTNGWKVELARKAKKKIIEQSADKDTLALWGKLFKKFQ